MSAIGHVPVLFLIYKRLETSLAVLSGIRKAKPSRLYIASDGPRKGDAGESALVMAVREAVIGAIDWDCDVKTLLRDSNLGCRYGVSGAIDWFFSHEERGIILEDDCLPDSSFFGFCSELLDQYADDLRVWHISGGNFQDGRRRGQGDYYFSHYTNVWGWATWANRWQYYKSDLEELDEFCKLYWLDGFWDRSRMRKSLYRRLREVKEGKLITWDYQWVYTVLSNSGLNIVPNCNLISNIGFGDGATHTRKVDKWFSRVPLQEMDLPLVHPRHMIRDKAADLYVAYKQKKVNRCSLSINRLLGRA